MKPRILLATLALSIATPAFAADKKPDPAKEQMRRLQLTQRKLEQEKTEIAQEKSQLEGKLKDVQRAADDSRKRASAAAGTIAALKSELATAKADREEVAAKLVEAEQQIVRLGEQQRVVDADRQRLDSERRRLEAALAEHRQTIASCEDHNAKLHALGTETLDFFRSKGCFDSALKREPFTGLRKVEIENAIEDHRERLDEHKLAPMVRPPGGTGGAG